MWCSTFFAGLTLVGLSAAQSSICGMECMGQALSDAGCSPGDVNCICPKLDFDKVSCCVYSACSNPDDAKAWVLSFVNPCKSYYTTPLDPSTFACPNGGSGASSIPANPCATLQPPLNSWCESGGPPTATGAPGDPEGPGAVPAAATGLAGLPPMQPSGPDVLPTAPPSGATLNSDGYYVIGSETPATTADAGAGGIMPPLETGSQSQASESKEYIPPYPVPSEPVPPHPVPPHPVPPEPVPSEPVPSHPVPKISPGAGATAGESPSEVIQSASASASDVNAGAVKAASATAKITKEEENGASVKAGVGPGIVVIIGLGLGLQVFRWRV